jgi:hypothetical protein
MIMVIEFILPVSDKLAVGKYLPDFSCYSLLAGMSFNLI